MLTDELLADLPGVRHGFFTRRGGCSEGIYASLNCGLGSGDDTARVSENRRRAAARLDLDAERLTTAYQVHSAAVRTVEAPWPGGQDAPRVDGLVTDRPGIALGILTADCVPILFADGDGRVVGAAHAGWKGAMNGVLEATVRAMEALGANRSGIVAVTGPCIHQSSYEVGPEYKERFVAAAADNERYFVASDRADHFRFDLPGYVAARLRTLDLAAVSRVDRDTCAEEDLFFSYRRNTLRGEKDYGRGLSAIALAAAHTG